MKTVFVLVDGETREVPETEVIRYTGGKWHLRRYRFLGKIFSYGDKFETQEEKPNTNKYNPTGKAINTFYPNSYNGVVEIL